MPGAWADGLALLVPAYFEPASGLWGTLANAAARAPLIAIANLFNGPGSSMTPRADYVAAIRGVRIAGGQVIGYVYTQYGKRPLAAVKDDMRRWHELYPLDGFFVDEMSNDPSAPLLAYYAELLRYARELRSTYRVIGNPGTNTDELYLLRQTADVLVIFENHSGYATFSPSAWTRRYTPPQFGNLVYSIPSAEQMTNCVNLAINKRAGLLYVTDDSGANPWDSLPSYWAAEVSLFQSVNGAAAGRVSSRLNMKFADDITFNLEGQGAVGRYILEGASPLGNWQPLSTNLTITGTSIWQILNLPSDRFFRLRQE
jgi:hypothetical protein